jgi:hypothetical protein
VLSVSNGFLPIGGDMPPRLFWAVLAVIAVGVGTMVVLAVLHP